MSWTDVIAASADDLRSRGMACILLWMQGGPSQFETFSPKPAHANGGGTKAIDTSAPVSFMASATVANTGSSMSLPSLSTCETLVPALRALTPPTTWVPAFSMRAVCLVPSPPVMPCTMTLESLFRKIDILYSFSLRFRIRRSRARRPCRRPRP
ncbi:MAG: DUF1501 domain-containing protein, partial [Planctomycetales bacterium]|nr:DUF1501 domain-containing protein [Planctomycetales bacterium]